MKKIYFDNKFARFILPKKIACITLFGLTFFKERKEFIKNKMINHEKIHAEQQKECLFLGFIFGVISLLMMNSICISLIIFLFFFYIWYGTEYLILLINNKFKKKNINNKISFEAEALENESDNDYLRNERQLFSWINYIGC